MKTKFIAKLNKQVTNLKGIYSKIWKHKLICFIYILIVLVLVIITVKHHRKENMEHFADREFKNKYYQYSQCKKKCVVKYNDPDQAKACKKHCKCKKNCITNKNP